MSKKVYILENIYDSKKVKIFMQERLNDFDFISISANDSFVPPASDFFLITSAGGVSILEKPLRNKSFGVFSSKPGSGLISVSYTESRLNPEKDPAQMKELFYVGGAYFNFEGETVKASDSAESFIRENMHCLAVTHGEHSARPALFLDRDGVINHDCGYPSSVDQIKLYEDIIPIIKLANEYSWLCDRFNKSKRYCSWIFFRE